jgi:hypothetical protein
MFSINQTIYKEEEKVLFWNSPFADRDLVLSFILVYLSGRPVKSSGY